MVVLPALSVALANAVEVYPPTTVIGSPIVTEHVPSSPDSASMAVHVGITYADWATVEPLAGEINVTVGFVRSILIGDDEADVTLPATSDTENDCARFAPSALSTTGAGHDATPDRASAHAADTVTALLFQPNPLLAIDVDTTMSGAVRSTLAVYEPVAQLPAGSHDDAEVTVMFAPSLVIAMGAGMVAVWSSTDQLIVTGPLFQPLALAAGEGTPVTCGAVVSINTDPDCDHPLAVVTVHRCRPSPVIMKPPLVGTGPRSSPSTEYVAGDDDATLIVTEAVL